MKKSYEIIIVLFIFAISFITFNYVFTGTAEGSYFQNIIAALLGTLFTVSITAFLLKQQAKAEVLREQNVEVFRKKVERYEKMTRLLQRVLADDRIDKEEAVEEPQQDLLEMAGMDNDLAYKLAELKICTMEDLAEQAIDELMGIDGMTEERASELIMTARAPWFENESNEADQ